MSVLHAGNLYVNRPITGAVVGRQPFGGHKASSFGSGFKAGGPNTVLGLVRVTGERERVGRDAAVLSRGPRIDTMPARVAPPSAVLETGPLADAIAEVLRDGAPAVRDVLACRLRSYERALTLELVPVHVEDQILGHEELFVYRPCRVVLLVLRGTSPLDALSAGLAGRAVAADLRVLLEEGAGPFSQALLAGLEAEPISGVGAVAEALFGTRIDRLRIVGGEAAHARTVLAGLAPSVEHESVHESGYVELRRYALEQSRSVARHRHGNLSLERAGALFRAKRGSVDSSP
jgi:RHH-type proline utilization regulon transcriptional repressor/proline dehydrogenase/delta 1-pyrroline-5-carboxylate dehydrogenase